MAPSIAAIAWIGELETGTSTDGDQKDICHTRLGIAPITPKPHGPFGHQAPTLAVFSGRRVVMSIARIVEISSTSDKSFEDAIVQGIARASKTLRDIKGAWVKEQGVTVRDNKVVDYKVILKVTFELEAA
jgi:flavin-binding protein dodecin